MRVRAFLPAMMAVAILPISTLSRDTPSWLARTINRIMATQQAPAAGVDIDNSGYPVERSACLTIAVGPSAAAECGNLRIVHQLPSTRTFDTQRTPTLLYNSEFAHPYPIIAIRVLQSITTTIPDSVQVRFWLVINGVDQPAQTQRWPGNQWTPGSIRRLAFVYNAFNDTTGFYNYKYEVANIYGGVPIAGPPVTGIMPIVNRKNSRFGAGWWLAGLEQLLAPNPAHQVIVWVDGDGSARQFLPNATNRWTTSAYARVDTLIYNPGTPLKPWTRVGAEGVRIQFDANGQHVETVNRFGHTTTFTHSAGSLIITLPPAGQQYTFLHPSNRLTSVIAPPIGGTSRVTTVTNPGGLVTAITNPGAAAVNFAYRTGAADSNLMAKRTDRMAVVDTFGYDTGKRLISSRIKMSNPTNDIVVSLIASESRGRAPTAVDTSDVTTFINGPRTDVGDTTVIMQSRFGPARKLTDAYGNTTRVQHKMCVPPWPQTCGWSPVRIQTPTGRVQHLVYDLGVGNPTHVIDSVTSTPGVRDTTRYVWNTKFDQLAMIIRPEKDTTVFQLDATDGKRLWQQSGTPASDTSRRVNFTYHATSKRLLTIVLPKVNGQTATYTYTYDARGNTETVKTPKQYVTTYTNDVIGRLIKTISPIDTAQNQKVEQRLTYDLLDRITDDTSLVTAFGGGAPQESTFVRHTYNNNSQRLSTMRWMRPNPNGINTLTTQWRYDQAGRQIAEQAPDGGIDSVVVDHAGNPTVQVGRRFPSGPVITSTYDALNRVVIRVIPSVSRAQPTWLYLAKHGGASAGFPYPYVVPRDSQTYSYAPDGQLATANNRYARVTRTYYPHGLLETETQQIARVDTTFSGHSYTIQYSYDRNGRRRRVRAPSIFATAAGDSIKYAYHAVTGDLVQVRDASGAVFSFQQTVRGEDSTIVYPGSYTRRMSWDADGRLVRDRINNDGGTTGGRWPHNPIRNIDTMRYDARSKLLRSGDGAFYNNRTQATYGGLGAVATLGTRSTWRNPFGSTTEFGSAETLAHDPMGNLYTSSRFDSTKAGASVVYFTANKAYAYQASTGRLTGITKSGTQSGASVYTYDAAGNTDYDRETSYFSGTDRERVSIYGLDNRLVALDTWVTPASFTPWVEHYNEEYRYDALGRRVWTWMQSPCVNSVQPECYSDFIRRTVWDGTQELAEIQAPGTAAASAQWEQDSGPYSVTHSNTPGVPDPNRFYGQVLYTPGPIIDAPLSVIRFNYTDTPVATPVTWTGTKTIVPFWNAQGTAPLGAFGSGVVDTAYNGALPCVALGTGANRCYIISWFGSRTAYDQQHGNQTRYAWHGSLLEGKRDGAGGLDYRRNRYYDARTGRFTQEDPIGLAGGLNLYGFAAGDPVNFSDPFGLCPIPPSNCLDVGMAVVSVAKFIAAPSVGTAIDAALDVAGALPGVPSVGVLRRALGAADDVADVARGGERAVDFLVTSKGTSIPVPTGATGPHATRAPGVQFLGGQGGKGMDARVTGVRVMDETAHHRRRVIYMNKSGQTVSPTTGRTLRPDDPTAHIYLP